MTIKAIIFDFGGVISKTLFETHDLTEIALGLFLALLNGVVLSILKTISYGNQCKLKKYQKGIIG